MVTLFVQSLPSLMALLNNDGAEGTPKNAKSHVRDGVG